MIYIKVIWNQQDPSYPTIFYSELDSARYETRKVVSYLDGRLEFTNEDNESDELFLAEHPVPTLLEISEDPEFEAVEISQSEFEKIWDSAQGRKVERISFFKRFLQFLGFRNS